MKKVFNTNSPAETEALAENLAKKLNGGEVIAFFGGMGQGKTCFVRGLARGLGFVGTVTSPTFALVNEYRGGNLPLFHFDMYRVTTWEDLDSTAFFEYMDEGGVIACEWSENIVSALPEDTIKITIETVGETSRKITVESGAEI